MEKKDNQSNSYYMFCISYNTSSRICRPVMVLADGY